jgi:hypothetical protein
MIDIGLLRGILLMILGQTMAWFQVNSQFVWPDYRDKLMYLALVLSLPITFTFIEASKYIYEYSNNLWGVRFLSFAISYITFPILTWYLLSEPIFSKKNIICTILSATIIYVQMTID